MECNFLFQKKEITMTLIHPTYFPNIEHFNHILKSNYLCFEINDFYQKQTFRNRTSIYGSNGKLNLAIPVKYSYKNKEKLKDIKICNDTKWQKNHLKSIQISYRSSPYFEFFEDYFSEFFKKKEKFLIDISIKSIDLIVQILELELNYSFTKEYKAEYHLKNDLRNISNRKIEETKNIIQRYPQVFDNRHGHIQNLSILDLIFNEGIGCLNFFNKSKI
ncbi:MAG: hypothetical protein CMC36_03595 [Flavobacteriaceae bacterium]|nr:hypothetical protein [Flavobacteriaceae bacterium]